MKSQIQSVGCEHDSRLPEAYALASALNVTVDSQVLPRLSYTEDKLVLLIDQFSPLFVDFSHKVWQKRHNAGKKQGLVRACKPDKGMHIIDATAGWGRDAALLASYGAHVLMLERQPLMAALLTDGLNRILDDSFLKDKLSLLMIDAKQYLQTLKSPDYPDVIYIDPMHPQRQKSALVKKDMQALQQLIGSDGDVLALLQLAVQRCKHRVVMKWPQRLPPLIEPDGCVNGKTVRFDIYRGLR